ncbi:hypothetical protein ARSEF4850_008960, partial [Beauveria asiatica]
MAHLRGGNALQSARQQLQLRSTAAGRSPVVVARWYSMQIEPEHPKPPREGNSAKLGRSFQGQVMGSIGARLRREREQRAQYEQWRNITDPARNWMITF